MPDNPLIPPPSYHGFRPENPLPGRFIEFVGLKFYGKIPIPLPSPLFVTWLAPKPLGITPPRYFGLPEDYFFGFTPTQVYDLLTGEAAARGARDRAERFRRVERSETRLELLLNLQPLSGGELETVITNTRDPRHTYSFPREVIIEAAILTYELRTNTRYLGRGETRPLFRPERERLLEAFLVPPPNTQGRIGQGALIPPPSAAGAPIDTPPASMAQAAAAAIAKEPVKFLVTERTDP